MLFYVPDATINGRLSTILFPAQIARKQPGALQHRCRSGRRWRSGQAASVGKRRRKAKRQRREKREKERETRLNFSCMCHRVEVSVTGLQTRLDAGILAIRVWLMAIKRYLASTPSHLTSARTFKVLREESADRPRYKTLSRHTSAVVAAATYYNDIILAPPH